MDASVIDRLKEGTEFAPSGTNKNPESKPPSKLSQGEANDDCVTEWLLWLMEILSIQSYIRLL